MEIIARFQAYNERRYSRPWVAIVNPETAKPDFSRSVGGYTGDHGKGEEGDLYVTNPVESAVYMYGQKDHRGSNTERYYVQYRDGEFHRIESTNLIAALQNRP